MGPGSNLGRRDLPCAEDSTMRESFSLLIIRIPSGWTPRYAAESPPDPAGCEVLHSEAVDDLHESTIWCLGYNEAQMNKGRTWAVVLPDEPTNGLPGAAGQTPSVSNHTPPPAGFSTAIQLFAVVAGGEILDVGRRHVAEAVARAHNQDVGTPRAEVLPVEWRIRQGVARD